MQAALLLRSLSRREKLFSIIIACFQLGVACASLFDLRFVPVFIAMCILLPRALWEVETETFGGGEAPRPVGAPVGALIAIAGISIVFFLAFPRGQIGAARFFGSGPGANQGLLDSFLDPSGSDQASRSACCFKSKAASSDTCNATR